MAAVEINGRTVTIERFTLAKAMRVITLLQLMQRAAPEITKAWATFRLDYAKDYGQTIDRINAIAQFGEPLARITDEEWERAGQKFTVPGSPSQAEVFFAMAPVFYEKVEDVTLRLLGLIAMDNDTVNRHVGQGDIWPEVDKLVDDVIRTAPLDEVMELLFVAAEVIDAQVLAKARGATERLGNVLRLLGLGRMIDSTASTTSNESREQPSSDSSTGSPSDTDGPPTSSGDSTGGTSTSSATASLQTV